MHPSFLSMLSSHPLLIIGVMTLIGFYAGKAAQKTKLPSIIGFMILGVVLGPSVLNVLDADLFSNLSFISDIALGFVALSIGMELHFGSLKQLGKGIWSIIMFESFAAFAVGFFAIYFVTGNLPMALVFGSIAPASAPAGTVAVIREYRAKGPLTKALFAVVGFDDGIGIIIFGFASAIARNLLTGGNSDVGNLITGPLLEILASFAAGILLALIFGYLAARVKNPSELIILLFSIVLAGCGLSNTLGLSLILTNMTLGMVVANSGRHGLISKISTELIRVMPLLFIMFFIMAGANLHVNAIPALGVIGIVYIIARTTGLIGGAVIGAAVGKAQPVIKNTLVWEY